MTAWEMASLHADNRLVIASSVHKKDETGLCRLLFCCFCKLRFRPVRHMVFARTHFLVPELQRKNIGAVGRNIIICGSGTKKPRSMDITSGRQNPGLHY